MLTVVLPIAYGALGLAMLLGMWRLLRGPDLPDRILALDTLYVNAVALLMLLVAADAGGAVHFEAALLIALLGFVATVALAMHPVMEFAISAWLLVGSFFALVGAIGLVRLPDFFMRLHAPTKATTLGVGGMLIAALLFHFAQGVPDAGALLVTLFLFVTAPVSANLLAKAALRLKLDSKAPLPEDRT
jgi:multicomponent K+:H+ antiporter subunit G